MIGEGTFSQILEAIDMYHQQDKKEEEAEDDKEAVTNAKKELKVAIKVMKVVEGQRDTTLMHNKIGQQVQNTFKNNLQQKK